MRKRSRVGAVLAAVLLTVQPFAVSAAEAAEPAAIQVETVDDSSAESAEQEPDEAVAADSQIDGDLAEGEEADQPEKETEETGTTSETASELEDTNASEGKETEKTTETEAAGSSGTLETDAEEEHPSTPVWHTEWQGRYAEFALGTRFQKISARFLRVWEEKVSVRNREDLSGTVIAELEQDAVVRLIAESDYGWSYIETKAGDGTVVRGYVDSMSLIETTETEDTPAKVEIVSDDTEAFDDVPETTYDDVACETAYVTRRQQLVNYGLQFLGNPYIWGGTSLTNGTDCSGFTQSVFAHFGISLPRTAEEQSTAGTRISVDEAQPGDLIFYSNSEEGVYHVVICYSNDGNGNIRVLHASCYALGILISDLNRGNACWAATFDYYNKEETPTDAEEGQWTVAGEMRITSCDREDNGLLREETESAEEAENDRIVLTDPDSIPAGSTVYIKGYGLFTAEAGNTDGECCICSTDEDCSVWDTAEVYYR